MDVQLLLYMNLHCQI